MNYDKNRRQICSISGGKDSTALAIFLKDKIPNLEYVFCDTGSELAETYKYLKKLEKLLGKKIVYLNRGKGFEYFLKKFNYYLPSPRARWCTRELKIKPFEKYIGDDPVESYVGLRADEKRKGYISIKKNILARYPFKEEGIDLNAVNNILDKSGIGRPTFYSWRTRSGCYFCFFQRRIEWIGLLEKHPKLFKKAQDIEKKCEFTWDDYGSLEEVKKDKEFIKDRYEQRKQTLINKKKQLSFDDLFRKINDEDNDIEPCVTCDI